MTECIAYEPVYATVGVDESPDWSGGAVSTVSYYANCWFGWTVPRVARGVVVGLNELDSGPYFTEIDHGFRFKDGQYKFFELGQLIDPTTPFTTYNEGDRFYVFRIGSEVLYVLRPVGTDGNAVFTDSRYPEYRFPGNILRVSPIPSYGEVFLDASFWAYNDTVDNERSGDVWTTYAAELNPDNLYVDGTVHPIARSGTMYGALPLALRGADSTFVDATAGAIDASLLLSVSGSGSTQVKMELQLPLNVTAFGYSVESFILGELPLSARGGTYMTGDAHQGIKGFLPLAITGRGYSGSTAILGELPAPVIAATTSRRTDPMNALIMGELPLSIVATGTEDGQTRYKTWMVGELPLEGRAIGGDVIGTPATAGVMELSLPLDVNGSGTGSRGTVNSFIDIEMPAPVLYAMTSPEAHNEFFITLAFTGEVVTEPPISPGFTINVSETFYALTAPLQVRYANNLRSRMRVLAQTQTFQQLALDLTETASVLARIRGDFILQVAESYSITDSITVTQSLAIAESLLAVGAVQSLYHGLAAVVAAATFGDSVRPAGSASMTSEVQVSAAQQMVVQRVASLLDVVSINSLMSNVLTIVVNELAELTAGDEIQLTRQLLAELMDEVDLYALIKTPSELVQGWVMNTEGAMPISEYDNFTFNSMTQFKDKFYGTTDDGLYIMGADTDASLPITAELSSLMLDLGSSRMKRIRSAYLGYTASNQLVLKVRAVSDGQLSEHWYKARPVAIADAPREGYVRVGQGLRSRYWQFELTNVGGGDFEVDQLELYPLFLNRRV